MLAFFMDGTNMSISGFNKIKQVQILMLNYNYETQIIFYSIVVWRAYAKISSVLAASSLILFHVGHGTKDHSQR